MKKHTIRLNQEQREQLEQVVKKGRAPARQIMHAQVLLKQTRENTGQVGQMPKSEKHST